MATSMRHQARELAMQALYEWDVTGHDPLLSLERLVHTASASARLASFAHTLIQQVLAHLAKIDERLAATAAERPLSQMARTEKAILRLAISEILFDNGVPARAAINEAVELAKTFGGDHSARFVNGVLGTIYAVYTHNGASSDVQSPQLESEDPHNGHQPELGDAQESDR